MLICVLNLIITGIPSIQGWIEEGAIQVRSFKPYYNWNTFNTSKKQEFKLFSCFVLNLIITGIPSILLEIYLPSSN